MGKQDRLDEHRARRKDREASVVGSLSDMGVADLVQTLEMGRKSGVLHLKARTGARGTCWMRDGRVVDCELTGAPAGDEAFYRLLRWREGGFAIEFKPVVREARIALPTQALLLQGMRRIDDWGRLVEQLPPLDRRLEIDVARLGERLSRLPDEVNTLLRLFDGHRTLGQVLEAAPRGESATAEDVVRLVADGILREQPEGAEPPAMGEPAAAAPARPGSPEPGWVDWFAGPVGATAAAAPVASWSPAPPAASARAEGAAWLQPPTTPSPVAPRPADRPRPVPRFSIPVPPPGSLPPPPSVAETLARYQVVPRPLRPAAPAAPAETPVAPERSGPEPAPLASPPGATLLPVPPGPTPAAPDVSTPALDAAQPQAAAPEVAPGAARAAAAAPELAPPSRQPQAAAPEIARAAASEPAHAEAGAPGSASASLLGRRLQGDVPAPPRDPGSFPAHPPEDLARERPAKGPRRSAAPYAAVGLIALAVLVGGTALTDRRVLRPAPSIPQEAAAAVPDAPATAEPAAARGAPPALAPPAEDRPARGALPVPAEAAPPAAPAADAPAPAAEPARQASPAPAAVPARQVPASPVPARRAVAAPRPAPLPVTPAPAPAALAVAMAKPVTPSRPPATPAAIVEPRSRKLLATADRKYAAGRYAEAIADYRRAIAQRSSPAAHVALARALHDAHRSAEAIQELDGVLSDDPRDAGAWLLRGDIQQGEGRTAEAREAYKRFLELQPQGEQARNVRMLLGREPQ